MKDCIIRSAKYLTVIINAVIITTGAWLIFEYVYHRVTGKGILYIWSFSRYFQLFEEGGHTFLLWFNDHYLKTIKWMTICWTPIKVCTVFMDNKSKKYIVAVVILTICTGMIHIMCDLW